MDISTTDSERERETRRLNEKEASEREGRRGRAGKKNGIARMFNEIVPEAKAPADTFRGSYSNIMHEAGTTELALYRPRAQQQVPLYIQFVVITGATGNMPKYISAWWNRRRAHASAQKCVFR